MKIESYTYPKSSFLSIEKDMNLIIDALLKNGRLKKYLYYNTRDCLNQPELSEEQSLELINNNIKIVPNVPLEGTMQNYIVIHFDDFIPNFSNPEFRDNIIEIDILCHTNLWQLDGYQLRPYRIAAEIDSLLDKKHLTGIGKTEFQMAKKILIDNDYAGVCLTYRVVHGEEDKINMLNPIDEEQFLEDFKEMMNA